MENVNHYSDIEAIALAQGMAAENGSLFPIIFEYTESGRLEIRAEFAPIIFNAAEKVRNGEEFTRVLEGVLATFDETYLRVNESNKFTSRKPWEAKSELASRRYCGGRFGRPRDVKRGPGRYSQK